MDVTHGIIHLVQSVLVVLVASHAAQFLQHGLGLSGIGGCNFGLQDSGVEREFKGRTEAHTLFQGSRGFLVVSELAVHLSDEEIESRFLLLGSSVAGGALQEGQSVGKSSLTQKQVGAGGIHLFGHASPVGECVSERLGEGIFCIIEPVQLCVASRHPLTRFGDDDRLSLVVAGDVGEGSGSLQEFSLLELRLRHEQPRFFEEGIELLSLEILFCLGRFSLSRTHLGFAANGVQLNRFLTLGDGGFIVSLSCLARLFASHEEDGQQLSVVIDVGGKFGFVPLDEGLLAVEIGVEACVERMPKT